MKTWKTRAGKNRLKHSERMPFIRFLATLPDIRGRADCWHWQCSCGTCKVVEYKGICYCGFCGNVKATATKRQYYTKEEIENCYWCNKARYTVLQD